MGSSNSTSGGATRAASSAHSSKWRAALEATIGAEVLGLQQNLFTLIGLEPSCIMVRLGDRDLSLVVVDVLSQILSHAGLGSRLRKEILQLQTLPLSNSLNTSSMPREDPSTYPILPVIILRNSEKSTVPLPCIVVSVKR